MNIYVYKTNPDVLICSTEPPNDSVPYIILNDWPVFSNKEVYDIDYENGELITKPRTVPSSTEDKNKNNDSEFFTDIINSI